VKILVSNEPDDEVGRDLLGRIEGVEVLPYTRIARCWPTSNAPRKS
jgi:hypothetical protein